MTTTIFDNSLLSLTSIFEGFYDTVFTPEFEYYFENFDMAIDSSQRVTRKFVLFRVNNLTSVITKLREFDTLVEAQNAMTNNLLIN